GSTNSSAEPAASASIALELACAAARPDSSPCVRLDGAALERCFFPCFISTLRSGAHEAQLRFHRIASCASARGADAMLAEARRHEPCIAWRDLPSARGTGLPIRGQQLTAARDGDVG